MQQLCQDGMAISREMESPDLFILHLWPIRGSPSFQRNLIHPNADPTQAIFHGACPTRFFSFSLHVFKVHRRRDPLVIK